ncbi:MAG TPA: nitroreductase family protein [Spirochaetota bacterium]|nr:nitroreductase family protein [Spirochaetota bacterium]HOD16421.1 nitroreductase family protein [Spirochaetota bacterium]HPN11125.1 nitroreductase family protein [Spirochaetota bacterium]
MITIPIIDHEHCTLCGRCVEICPKQVLVEHDGRITPTVDECMLCSHCYTVCHYNAIRFDPDALVDLAFRSFPCTEKMYAPGRFNPAELVNLVRSRRSVRKYRDAPVDDAVLSDLVEFAVSAPSGSNCQNWEFLVVNGRDRVWALALEIGRFFEKLNRLARNPFIRWLSVPFMGGALVRYRRDHMESVEMGLREAAAGNDLLFHAAHALVIVHGTGEGSTPLEDAQYASYNMTLLAHALGLGTCYIGYAVESINRAASIKRFLGLPSANTVYAVLAVGYPDTDAVRPALRKKYRVRFF